MKAKINKSGEAKVVISDFDIWDLHVTLAEIIVPSLKKFKDRTNSYPGDFDTENDDIGMDQWLEVIDKMIYAFEHVQNEEWKEKLSYDNHEVINRKIQEGLDLFAKYYRHLWI